MDRPTDYGPGPFFFHGPVSGAPLARYIRLAFLRGQVVFTRAPAPGGHSGSIPRFRPILGDLRTGRVKAELVRPAKHELHPVWLPLPPELAPVPRLTFHHLACSGLRVVVGHSRNTRPVEPQKIHARAGVCGARLSRIDSSACHPYRSRQPLVVGPHLLASYRWCT